MLVLCERCNCLLVVLIGGISSTSATLDTLPRSINDLVIEIALWPFWYQRLEYDMRLMSIRRS